jgi:phage shock protein C
LKSYRFNPQQELTMEHSVRRITRSRRDRVFAGVCGGLAGYLGLDPVLVRVLYVALTLLSWGMGIVLYLLAWIVVPLESEGAPPPAAPRDEPTRRDARRIAGLFLVIIGLLAMLFTSWFHVFTNVRTAGPVILLAVGIVLLIWRKAPAAVPEVGPLRTYGAEEDAAPASSPTFARAEPRRLTRLESGRKIAGVCAGLGEYLYIDPTIVRLLFIAAIFAGGAGLILYLIMWLVVPLKHDVTVSRIGT